MKFEKARNIYLDLFTQVSIGNLDLANLTFHLLLGQLFCRGKNGIFINFGNLRYDTRTHIFYLAPSGTGKTTSFSFLTKILKDIDIKYNIQKGELTDASLIGSMQKQRQKNKDVSVEQKGLLRDFEEGGILLIDEASILFKSKNNHSYASSLISHFQIAMDTYDKNYVTRRTINGEIGYHTFPSILYLSHPFEIDFETIVNSGFFQRQFFFQRNFSTKDWNKLTKDFVTKQLYNSKILYGNEYQKLIKILKKLKSINKNDIYIDNSKDIENVLLSFSKYVDNITKGYKDGDKKDLLNTYKIRSIEQMIKIASHKALWNKKDKITLDDITYAFEIMKQYFKNFIEVLDSQMLIKEDKIKEQWNEIKINLHRLRKKLKLNKEVINFPKKEFKDFVIEILSISESSYYRVKDKFKQRDYIKEEKNNIIIL